MIPVDPKYKWYLYDLGYLLKERALEAKEKKLLAPANTPEREFESGRALAYYEVISLLLGQAVGFDIPLEDLRLEDFNPDRDLL